MRRKELLVSAVLALAVAAAAGLPVGSTLVRAAHPPKSVGYVCPLTGEELPCSNCCPVNVK